MAFSKASHASKLGGVFPKNTAETTLLKATLGRHRSAGNASLHSKFAICKVCPASVQVTKLWILGVDALCDFPPPSCFHALLCVGRGSPSKQGLLNKNMALMYMKLRSHAKSDSKAEPSKYQLLLGCLYMELLTDVCQVLLT